MGYGCGAGGRGWCDKKLRVRLKWCVWGGQGTEGWEELVAGEF
jgi:hypothetical protein